MRSEVDFAILSFRMRRSRLTALLLPPPQLCPLPRRKQRLFLCLVGAEARTMPSLPRPCPFKHRGTSTASQSLASTLSPEGALAHTESLRSDNLVRSPSPRPCRQKRLFRPQLLFPQQTPSHLCLVPSCLLTLHFWLQRLQPQLPLMQQRETQLQQRLPRAWNQDGRNPRRMLLQPLSLLRCGRSSSGICQRVLLRPLQKCVVFEEAALPPRTGGTAAWLVAA
jgi:hypothetical protein